MRGYTPFRMRVKGQLPAISATVATITQGNFQNCSNNSKNSSPVPINSGWESKLDDLTERAGMLIGNNIPRDQADGLALLMLILPFNSMLTAAEQDQAEAALGWLIDNRRRE